jgi:hypothetical protein
MNDDIRIALEELPDGAALDQAGDAIRHKLAEGGSRLAALKWDMFSGAVVGALRDRLAHLDALQCLASAWCTASEIRKLAQQTRAAPGTQQPLPLGQHTLSADLHPEVTLSCGPATFPPLRFTLKLEAAIEGAILIIAEGKLSAMEAATLTPSAALYYGDQRLNQLPGRKLSIARPYVFANGGLLIPEA